MNKLLKTDSKSDFSRVKASGDFVWDGKDEDDRPLTREQMKGGVVRTRGRPKSETVKESVTIRLDADVVSALRQTGDGWQTRVNDLVRAAVALKLVG